jgi:hypothetical protein
MELTAIVILSTLGMFMTYKLGGESAYTAGYNHGVDDERNRLLQELIDRDLDNPSQRFMYN